MRPLIAARGPARDVSTAAHSAGAGASSTRPRRLPSCCQAAVLAVLLLAGGLLAVPTTRRLLLGAGLATALVSVPMGASLASAADGIDIAKRQGEVAFSDAEWAKRLNPEAYRVLRHEATERRWTSPLNDEKRAGTFKCAGCGAPLFDASQKYESGSGWPSFFETLPNATTLVADNSIPFMPRVEVRCRRCQGHLGHVFDDGPRPTGKRYCMNGLALDFQPAQGA